MLQIRNIVRKKPNLTDEFLNFHPEPGSTVYSFNVTDPQSRYLPMPWHTSPIDIESLWIETNPLQLDVHCTVDNLEQYRTYFLSLDCILSETAQYIQPDPTYMIEMQCDGSLEVLSELMVDDKPIATCRCAWQAQVLCGEELISGTAYIPRIFDAYYDFHNARNIYINGTIYYPDEFTQEHPLSCLSTYQISIEPINPSLPIIMSAMYVSSDKRISMQDKLMHECNVRQRM